MLLISWWVNGFWYRVSRQNELKKPKSRPGELTFLALVYFKLLYIDFILIFIYYLIILAVLHTGKSRAIRGTAVRSSCLFGTMGDQLRASLKPLSTIVLWWSEGFLDGAQLGAMMPIDTSLSASDIRLILFVCVQLILHQEFNLVVGWVVCK